jgi:hypothetical protein
MAAPGKRARDVAAHAAGFDSTTSYRRAREVIAHGTPELVEAMDAEQVSVAAAAELAKLPEAAQRQAVAEVQQGKKVTARKAARSKGASKKEAPTHDAYGVPIQEHAREAFQAVPRFHELLALLRKARNLFTEIANLPGGKFLTLPGVASYQRGKKNDDGTYADRFIHKGIAQALADVEGALPQHTVCPWRYADTPHPEPCSTCHGLNWTTALSDRAIPEVVITRIKEAYGV